MASEHSYSSMRDWVADNGELIEAVNEQVMTSGPISASDLEEGSGNRQPWWGWGDTKLALEHLFHAGRVAAGRRGNFERVYADPSTVLPADALDQPTPGDDEALRTLLDQSARGHGVGTATDLADYFRLPIRRVRPLLAEMAADGSLESVEVEGWTQPAFRHPEARLPRKVSTRTLVSPFDSIMWERDRVERLFDFRYRIEIYVPAGKRVHGYYVLPFLMDGRFVARVDLKADRSDSVLLVQAAHAEPGVDHGETAEALSAELRLLADWLALDDLSVRNRGDLAPKLATKVG